VIPLATRRRRDRERLVDDVLDVTRDVDLETHRRSPGRRQRLGDGLLEVLPRRDELRDTLVLEQLGDIGDVDAERRAVEDR
jgi:hypothetical protein